MMRALGRAWRLPLVPAASSTAPMLAAWPMQYVFTSQVRNCIVSYTASPAVMLPPGELMYR
jgi:hypothetical protein